MIHKTPEEHNFLTEEECSIVTQKVLNLKSLWINRGGFHTLGAASYLDMNEQGVYKKNLETSNSILKQEFDFVYKKIEGFFQSKLGKPIKFDLAFPGFHIFEFNSEMANLKQIAGIHVDTPHSSHEWGDISIDDNNTFSFTIPVVIPKGGAGLNYYNIDIDEDFISFYEAPKELQEKLLDCKQRIDYHNGRLYCHDFGFLHQISNDFPLIEGDMRITIQGHGILCNNEYYTIFF